MSPKAKVGHNGEPGEKPEMTESAPVEPAPVEPPATDADSVVRPDPSPFDSEEFLEANRRNRDKMRAAAEAKRTKEAAREERRETRGRGRGATSDEQIADRPGGRGGRWTVPVLSVLLIAALAAAGVFAYLYREADNRVSVDDQLDERRSSAVEVAGRYATELLTYDSADFAELDSRITDISTPAFAKDFIEGSRQAREGSAGAQAVASAKVKESALQSIASTQAVVLVALDQTVKSPQTDAQLPEGIPYQSMVKVTLELVDGQWRLSDFAVV